MDEGAVFCPECGSDDLAAVPPAESAMGSWALHCLFCGKQLPVTADVYAREEYPLLPTACPECGSYRLHNVEAPRTLTDEDVGRQWLQCADCAHEWDVCFPPKAGEVPAPPLPLPAAPATDEEPAECGLPVCPHCGSCEIVENDAQAAKTGLVRRMCTRCSEVWDEPVAEAKGSEELPKIRPDYDAAFLDRCPACGSEEIDACAPPDYAVESALSGFFKRLAGHGWRQCAKCGRTWER